MTLINSVIQMANGELHFINQQLYFPYPIVYPIDYPFCDYKN